MFLLKRAKAKFLSLTKGYQNVTASHHIITEHVDPAQLYFPCTQT